MTTTVIVPPEGGQELPTEPPVETEAIEAVAEAATEVAEIEAERDVQIAEIHADVETAHIEANAAKEHDLYAELEACQRNIATLQTTVTDLQEEMHSIQQASIQAALQPPSPMEPVLEESPVVMPESPESPAAPEPPKRPKKLRWI